MSSSLHIGIIPDGNRRWAKAQGLAPWKGHEKSADTFQKLIEWCREDPRVGILTIWVFSTENWKRDPQEVEKLMGMFVKYLQKEQKLFHEHRVRLLHSGRRDRLSPQLLALLDEVIDDTKDYTDFTLHLALDYGGKDEIVRAIKRCSESASDRIGDDFNEEELRAHVDQPDLQDIDLIVRTSGEQRTSNFFMLQSAYAEWIFSKKLFPDFAPEDLEAAIREYTEREKRFGS